MAVTTAPAPPVPLLSRLKTPRALGALVALAWLPLMICVMGGRGLGDLRDVILLPAIPAVALLYVVAVSAWKESWVALIGITLVFFWLFAAVTAPYLPLADPNQ